MEDEYKMEDIINWYCDKYDKRFIWDRKEILEGYYEIKEEFYQNKKKENRDQKLNSLLNKNNSPKSEI